MRIGIVQFPGSNCERETILAVKRAGMEAVEFLWNESHEKLRALDGYIIVGGFSYEDRSRAGVIAALDPVMQEIKLQSEAGKPILGICNGAQVLVETGLVPGLENNKLGMVLAENKRIAHGKILGTGFYNAWAHVRLSDGHQRNAFTRHLKSNDILNIPVAHGEGRFVMSEALLEEIKTQGLDLFQYCDAEGVIDQHFPVNPNGSMGNIAAVSNKAGNVMAMMPHPERTPNGDAIFNSMRDYIAEGHHQASIPLYYYPRQLMTPAYKKQPASHECIVELMITDNHALTVQNTLQQLGIPVKVRRQVHYDIQCDSLEVLEEIKKTGVLYNHRKEVELTPDAVKSPNAAVYLVRAKDDIWGLQKQQTLADHFAIQGVKAINQGMLWHFEAEDAKIAALAKKILSTNIVCNPNAHDCYQYHLPTP